MSIYIKNAKIPKCCAECPFDTFADDMHYCTTKQLSTEDYWECRPPFCPLTEVPEPHGRLIDADALADDLEASIIELDKVYKAIVHVEPFFGD